MAEGALRGNKFSSGLALILSDDDQKADHHNSHIVSCYDDTSNPSVERSIEYILDLPHKSIHHCRHSVDIGFIRSLLRNYVPRPENSGRAAQDDRSGISIVDLGYGPDTVVIDNATVCGELKIVRKPFLIESFTLFSSARVNACVWKGKWMYEVTLETSGVQQLGWATVSCPFSDRKGVGDAEDSYAYDGKRVSKWNKDQRAYGQSWVVGDVIGCCIDLDADTISFYRNGASLGLAFDGIRKMGPGVGYYPAISLSDGESCDLNFGSRPFRYPVDGFLPIQAPPSLRSHASYLLQCLHKLLEVQCLDKYDLTYFEKPRRLKRFAPLEELYYPLSRGICEEFFNLIKANEKNTEYIAWGPVVSFLLEVFGMLPPHDCMSLDGVIDLFLKFEGSTLLFQHVIMALSWNCRTAPLVLVDCPYSGSYRYLALACHMLQHENLMVLWWKSSNFQFTMEGFLSRKDPNKQDLQFLMPSVWWPGSSENTGSESSMMMTTTALSAAVNKMEEMHRELCRLVLHFTPPITPPQLPGSVFRKFLQNFILNMRGADHKMASYSASNNSVLVSLYTVILHFLSEGFPVAKVSGLVPYSKESAGNNGGFLHKGGKRSFPVHLFLKGDPHRTWTSRIGGSMNNLLKSHPVDDNEMEDVQWDEGCMDDDDARITHSTVQKPCCCSTTDVDYVRISKDCVRSTDRNSKAPSSSFSERSAHVAAECSTSSLSDEIEDKPSSSDRSETGFAYQPLQHLGSAPLPSQLSYEMLRQEELLDIMLLLYHLGVAPNFRQAFYHMSQQMQSLSLLDDTDKQIRENSCIGHVKHLRDVRNSYREELVECVRQCAWLMLFIHYAGVILHSSLLQSS